MQHLPPTYPVPGCCLQSALVLCQVKPHCWTHYCHQPWSIHWCCLWPQPIYTLFMALPSQPVCESLSCSERKPHRLCPSQQWCVVSGLPLQPQTSHQHGYNSWWKGAAPLSPVPAGVSGAGCQPSASESCGPGAASCTLAGHFLLFLGLLAHPQ